MKILIISSGFYPSNTPRGFRTTELTKELCRQGHDITLMTHYHPEQENLKNEFNFRLIDLGPRKYKLIKQPKNKLFNLIVRIINRLLTLFFEYPDIQIRSLVYKALKNHHEQYDLLISVAAPHPIHWGIAKAWNKKKPIAETWVADCGDPYYAAKIDRFKRPFYFKYIEQKWCRLCDYIAVPRMEFKESFLEEFHDKFVEIPQGFNLKENKALLKPYLKNEIPTFAYAGSFVPIHRDPTQFLQYLDTLDINYRFYIFTRQKHYVEPFLKKANGRIVLCDYIPREELISTLSTMDFLVNFMYDPYRYAPSKMIDYLITERPVLNVDYEFDTTLLDEFLKENYSRKFDQFSVDKFDITKVANQFISAHQNKMNLQS